jgi:hypothetical protein
MTEVITWRPYGPSQLVQGAFYLVKCTPASQFEPPVAVYEWVNAEFKDIAEGYYPPPGPVTHVAEVPSGPRGEA